MADAVIAGASGKTAHTAFVPESDDVDSFNQFASEDWSPDEAAFLAQFPNRGETRALAVAVIRLSRKVK